MTGQQHVTMVRETIVGALEHQPGSNARGMLLASAQEQVNSFIKKMGPADIYTAKRMVRELGL
jgi:hypothetical protein